jgi:predicted DNA-binding transcriptional regulator AlpA
MLARVGSKSTQIDQAIVDEEFPQPVLLHDAGRAIGWYEDEIDSWLEFRRARRDGIFQGNWKEWFGNHRPRDQDAADVKPAS